MSLTTPKFVQFCRGDDRHDRYHGDLAECPHCGLPPAKKLDERALNYLIGGEKVRSRARPERDAGDGYIDPYDDGSKEPRRAVLFCRGTVPVPHARHRGEGQCVICRGLPL